MIDVLYCDWHEGSSNHLPPTTPPPCVYYLWALPDGYVRSLETYHLACVKCLCTSKVILNLPPSLDLWHCNIPAIKKIPAARLNRCTCVYSTVIKWNVCVAPEVIASTANAGFIFLQGKEGNNNSWQVQIFPAGSKSGAAVSPTARALDGQPE